MEELKVRYPQSLRNLLEDDLLSNGARIELTEFLTQVWDDPIRDEVDLHTREQQTYAQCEAMRLRPTFEIRTVETHNSPSRLFGRVSHWGYLRNHFTDERAIGQLLPKSDDQFDALLEQAFSEGDTDKAVELLNDIRISPRPLMFVFYDGDDPNGVLRHFGLTRYQLTTRLGLGDLRVNEDGKDDNRLVVWAHVVPEGTVVRQPTVLDYFFNCHWRKGGKTLHLDEQTTENGLDEAVHDPIRANCIRVLYGFVEEEA